MNTKIAFMLIILFSACSPSDNNGNPDQSSTLEVSVTADATTVTIDQIIILTATANETINEISFSKDGGVTFSNAISSSSFTDTVNLYLDFDTLGSKSIVVKVTNDVSDVVDSTVNITVERGNAIKLQSVQLNSFYDIGNTWDLEYPTTDPNHLADVFFVLLKPTLNAFDGTRSSVAFSPRIWYRSAIKENESSLSWNLQNEDLYINIEELTPYIAFADDDGVDDFGIPAVGDLMLGSPSASMIPLGDYYLSQPNIITLEEPSINLEYVIGVDW
ncbi:hypothetical protein [Winogradskyella psychrotolerans]|uniref:hypothetical protein n=1 Tax=Winogradskyella psychrotolerans TaxID=1344585 RepID=UPI001C0725DA|nr:hypothetical protein [Winogradskyella psychrotolerans]MBU2926705.1 hypothetical protein [Winogradskyella psychrotolerans]